MQTSILDLSLCMGQKLLPKGEVDSHHVLYGLWKSIAQNIAESIQCNAVLAGLEMEHNNPLTNVAL